MKENERKTMHSKAAPKTSQNLRKNIIQPEHKHIPLDNKNNIKKISQERGLPRTKAEPTKKNIAPPVSVPRNPSAVRKRPASNENGHPLTNHSEKRPVTKNQPSKKPEEKKTKTEIKERSSKKAPDIKRKAKPKKIEKPIKKVDKESIASFFKRLPAFLLMILTAYILIIAVFLASCFLIWKTGLQKSYKANVVTVNGIASDSGEVSDKNDSKNKSSDSGDATETAEVMSSTLYKNGGDDIYVNLSEIADDLGLVTVGDGDHMRYLTANESSYALLTNGSPNVIINGVNIILPSPVIIEVRTVYVPEEFFKYYTKGLEVSFSPETRTQQLTISETTGFDFTVMEVKSLPKVADPGSGDLDKNSGSVDKDKTGTDDPEDKTADNGANDQ